MNFYANNVIKSQVINAQKLLSLLNTISDKIFYTLSCAIFYSVDSKKLQNVA